MKTDVMEDFRPVDAITKPDMIECNRPPDRREHSTTNAGSRLRAGIENVPEPFDRQAGLMEILPDLRDTQNRRAHAARQHVEGHQSADRKISLDNQPCAKKQNGDDDQMVHQLHGLRRDIAEAYHTKACRDVSRQLLLPPPIHLRLDCQRLQRLYTGYTLH